MGGRVRQRSGPTGLGEYSLERGPRVTSVGFGEAHRPRVEGRPRARSHCWPRAVRGLHSRTSADGPTNALRKQQPLP